MLQVGARARGSSRRLGVDRIDLYQLHSESPMFPPRSTMPRMRRLVEECLVGHVGVSNHSLRAWREAESALSGPVLSNQVRFSLIHRAPELDLLPWSQQNSRVVIAYSPLAQGLLSGRYQSAPPRNWRRWRPDFSAGARARLEPLIAALREIASEHDATPAQVALAWVISKPNVVAIPGASSVRQMEQNAAAADLVLTEGDLSRLNGLAPG